ncbi:MAG: IPT/TIG domain-containing protein [Chloroflexota bacterium]
MRNRCPWVLPFRTSRRSPDEEHGQILVLFALALVVVLGVAALVVDLGLLRSDRVRLQNALDAGALAGVQSMPAGASTISTVAATAIKYAQDNFPGLAAPAPTYRCLIGVDAAGLPRLSDMPSACNVSLAANSSQWRCTATACWAPCNPATTATDICNTIQLTASTTRNYGFGNAIGVSSGSTGATTAVACNGLCGASPTVPLDLVIIADRTISMGTTFKDGADIASLRAGARAVLDAYNPTVQRVAFGTVGPSSIYLPSAADASNSPAPACLGAPQVSTMAMEFGASTGVAHGTADSATNISHATPARLGTPVTNSASSGSSLTLAPSSAMLGTSNLLVATVSVTGVSTISTSQTGWTKVTNTSTSGSNNYITTSTFYRAAPSSSTTYTFTWTSGSSNRAAAIMTAYSGVDLTGIESSASAASTSSNSTTVAPGPITTANDDELVIGSYGIAYGSTSSGTNVFNSPSGLTEFSEKYVQNSGGPSVMLADTVLASHGTLATSRTGADLSSRSASGRWAATLLAFKPLPTVSATITIATPTTSGSGQEVYLATIAWASTSGSVTASTGWVAIKTTNAGTSSFPISVSTFYHVVGSEPATYSFTRPSTVNSIGTIVEYDGVDTRSAGANVLDPATASFKTASNTTSIAGSAIVTTVDDTQVIEVFANNAAAGSSSSGFTVPSSPSGIAEAADVSFNGTTAGPTVAVDDFQLASHGTASTPSVTGKSGYMVSQTFGLRAFPVDVYSIDTTSADALASWIPLGFSGLDTDSPALTTAGARGHAEAYSSNGSYVPGSYLAQGIACFDANTTAHSTGTNLATPLDMAVKYLQTYGRSGARKGIILETDGTPMACPSTPGSAICAKFTSAAAQTSADAAKAAGITLFTIGYGSADATLLGNMASTKAGSSTCAAAENLDGDTFFCAPTAADLENVFGAAAAALASGPHLVQIYPQPIVSSITPTTGSKAGGTTITVTGTGFTDAYQVTVGGTGTTFTIASDTSMTVRIPAAAATGAVDVLVTSPGGTSKSVAGDRFTYGP